MSRDEIHWVESSSLDQAPDEVAANGIAEAAAPEEALRAHAW